MKYIDYYEALGVSRTATEKEIKSAYRKLARQHHPDLHQGDAKKAAEEKFKIINEAYEVLGDPEKRAKYDRLGMNWQSGQDFQPGPDMGGFDFRNVNINGQDLHGFSDFFASLFGQDLFGRRGARTERQRGPIPGEDVEAEINLLVEELYNGGEKDIQIQTGGSSKTVKVKIPPRIYPGAVLRLKGLGGAGYGGGGTGDLLLRLNALPHPIWRIENQVDVETDLTIYPEQAVVGDKVSVPTPAGLIQLKIPAGIHNGQKLRLKDKGLKRKNGSFGDMFVRVKIDTPLEQSAEEVELYQKIFELRNR
ncbi:MAG: J domain-containing protein [Veillonellaceae bacterium]|nr:J domain-containing protein [Veillonellaceae bacterium]